jgi:F0F1-type ATP synthase membrane subunit b/b'
MSDYNQELYETRKAADKEFKDASIQIATEQAAASQEMKNHAESLAGDIASQALGRTIA